MNGRLTNNYKQRNNVIREKHRNVITVTSHLRTLRLNIATELVQYNKTEA